MAEKTKIEWTDATWNPITGCDVVSPGCTNCYAMRLAGTRLKHHPSRKGLTRPSKAGPVWTGEIRFNQQWLDQPLRWRKPRMIFVCAHGDLFHENVTDEMLDQIFAVMALCPHHTFQVLTKRPERMLEYVSRQAGGDKQDVQNHIAWESVPQVLKECGLEWRAQKADHPWRSRAIQAGTIWPLPNVLLGVSIEDQTRADIHRDCIKRLSYNGGWKTFVSYEPALGLVDWRGWAFLDWMICGGESGAGARPMHPDWARAARDYCASKKIPFHFKQWGEFITAKGLPGNLPIDHVFDDGYQMCRVGKKAAGRLLDGVEHNGFPEMQS